MTPITTTIAVRYATARIKIRSQRGRADRGGASSSTVSVAASAEIAATCPLG